MSITSPDAGSMTAPWKRTTLGCRTWRRIRISLAMLTRWATSASLGRCLAAFTATGDPWSHPASTTPKEPMPRSWSTATGRSLAATSQRSARPSSQTFSRFRLSSELAPSTVTDTESASRRSKMRPVGVVVGIEVGRDWHSSFLRLFVLGPSAARRSLCSALSSTSWNASSGCLQAVLTPMRNVGTESPDLHASRTLRLPTMNISTGSLAPVLVWTVVGSNTGIALARSRHSRSRSSSPSARQSPRLAPVMSLPISIRKCWSARTIVQDWSESQTVASHSIVMIASIIAFSATSAL
mmetsp:Transcript_23129/g.73231  ORF Transcript_23129/g.73231 Transcript_23129/m.73231 type:complete len:296 (+) Transcript_23129:332-1219(+)